MESLPILPCSLHLPCHSRPHARRRAAAISSSSLFSSSSSSSSITLGLSRSRFPNKPRGAPRRRPPLLSVRALDPHHHHHRHDSDAIPDEKGSEKEEDAAKNGDAAEKEEGAGGGSDDEEEEEEDVVSMQDLADERGVIKMRDLVVAAKKEDAVVKKVKEASVQDLVKKVKEASVQDLVKGKDVARAEEGQGAVKEEDLVIKGVDDGDDGGDDDGDDGNKEGCVLEPNPRAEAWDSGYVGSPVVRRYLSDDQERWMMWYSGKPKLKSKSKSKSSSSSSSRNGEEKEEEEEEEEEEEQQQQHDDDDGDEDDDDDGDGDGDDGRSGRRKEEMGLAVSSNGLHWSRGDGQVQAYGPSSEDVGKVLECSDARSNWWSFDTRVVKPSDVIVMTSMKGTETAGVYWGYYTGVCGEAPVELLPEPSGRSPRLAEPSGGSSRLVEPSGRSPRLVEPSGRRSGEAPEPSGRWLPPDQPEFEYRRDGRVFARRSRPGLAMSHDGRAWLKIEGDDHSGAILDVDPDIPRWDSLLAASPHVVYCSEDDLRMYYHSFERDSGRFGIGYARSRDGMKWVRQGKILLGEGSEGSFDELGVKCPHVVPHPAGDGYLMIYEGVSARGSVAFGLARSRYGLSRWERCNGGKPVFSVAAEADAWDSRGIRSPCLVHMGGPEWRLYYEGLGRDGRSGIGMAFCTADDELREFTRFQGLHVC